MRRLIGPLLILLAAAPVWPRVALVFRLASPPLAVQAGQQFVLCAANVGTADADITLNFVNARTGGIVAAKQVTLPPPGAFVPSAMPDPCLGITAEAIAPPSPAGPPLVVALMAIRHGVFQRAAAATAAVQATAAGANGDRRIVASVPLSAAAIANGGNSTIEIVR